MEESFPNAALGRYKESTNKLQRFQRATFKRFTANVPELADEFNQLAVHFNESFLPQYAGLCWLGAAQCEKTIANSPAEVDYLLRSARASIEADRDEQRLHSQSQDRSNRQGALRCYNQALACLADDSVMRAAVIRAIKKIQPHSDATSAFVSPSHRIWDLETAAKECVRCGDFVAALEKTTEIYDDIVERKMQSFYTDVLARNEVTRILLLLSLQLPPSRHSPSHIKLLDMFNRNDIMASTNVDAPLKLPKGLTSAISDLADSINTNDVNNIFNSIDRVLSFGSLTQEQRTIAHSLRLHSEK